MSRVKNQDPYENLSILNYLKSRKINIEIFISLIILGNILTC